MFSKGGEFRRRKAVVSVLGGEYVTGIIHRNGKEGVPQGCTDSVRMKGVMRPKVSNRVRLTAEEGWKSHSSSLGCGLGADTLSRGLTFLTY